jgi:hypothetical protein
VTPFVVCSFSGSPGVTALAMGLGGSVAGGLVIEADCAGGRLAARWQLRREPGVVSWAASRGAALPEEHAQRTVTGVDVVVGPEAGDVAATIWRSSGLGLTAAMGRSGRAVVIDAGRVAPGSPVLAALEAAGPRTLLVVRNEAAELAVAAAGLRNFGATADVGLVLVGPAPHSPSEVASVLGAPVAAVLPTDAAAAAAAGAGGPHRDLRGTPWARAVRTLAGALLAAHDGAAPAEGVVA